MKTLDRVLRAITGRSGHREADGAVTAAWAALTALAAISAMLRDAHVLAVFDWLLVAFWIHQSVECWKAPRAGRARIRVDCPVEFAERLEMAVRLAVVEAVVEAERAEALEGDGDE